VKETNNCFPAKDETKKTASKTWKPTVIRSWSLLALIIAFILVAVAILVLHSFASRQMLYRSAFVYQLDIRAFNARFSPQSVIASLLAVGVAMWWDIVDKVFRSMQPFLSMSQSTVNVRRGAALSYQSSYWLWATARAVMNSHWLLSLVTFGTTLCQVRKSSPRVWVLYPDSEDVSIQTFRDVWHGVWCCFLRLAVKTSSGPRHATVYLTIY
jgi:hypothetical protein